jgi:hypothetical protein
LFILFLLFHPQCTAFIFLKFFFIYLFVVVVDGLDLLPLAVYSFLPQRHLVVAGGHCQDISGHRPRHTPNHIGEFVKWLHHPRTRRVCLGPNGHGAVLRARGNRLPGQADVGGPAHVSHPIPMSPQHLLFSPLPIVAVRPHFHQLVRSSRHQAALRRACMCAARCGGGCGDERGWRSCGRP